MSSNFRLNKTLELIRRKEPIDPPLLDGEIGTSALLEVSSVTLWILSAVFRLIYRFFLLFPENTLLSDSWSLTSSSIPSSW
jgi:hypothetical protein